jgi:beta-glucuronidase
VTWCLGGVVAAEELRKTDSSELILKAWDAQGRREFEKALQYAQECIDLYKEEANRQHALLKDYPVKEQQPLSDVAVAYFIQAEAAMRQEKLSEAKEGFQFIVEHYRYAVAWDPSRGVYWKVAGVAQESIDKINQELSGKGKVPAEEVRPKAPKTKAVLYDPGTEDVIDYEKYGEFTNVSTRDYKYVIKDQEGLSRAVGEGIYPNTTSVRRDPNFKKLMKEGRLKGSDWDFVHTSDLEAAFLKWAVSTEPQGVKLFYTALALEKSGLLTHALKAYYAIVVHFPGAVGWTYWHTPWYVGQAAIAKIKFILRRHPELGLRLVDAKIRIVNGYDYNIANDIVIANPGRLERSGTEQANIISKTMTSLSKAEEKGEIKRTLGEGRVKLAQYQDNSWQLLVEGKPFTVKAITYQPTKIGQSPDEGTLGNWMQEDFNRNGKIDGPYDSYLENNPDKPIGDFQVMKDMGVNAIRLYHHPKPINKELLRDLYKTYGIRVIMGDFLGKYALGSKAPWNPGTNYSNPEHQKNMLDSVRKMVEDSKDEPYLLFWILGNENVYGVACNADKDPDGFFKFANEAARLIKSLDKNHPVAIASGDTVYLDRFAEFCPDIDIFGANSYRGDYGFGYLWEAVKEEADKPVMLTEFGCPAYARGLTQEEAEAAQANYHKWAWEDIALNMSAATGAGNSIGGIIFEFLDEWWKAYEPHKHDTKGFFTGPFPDGYMYEEWLGIAGQGDGKDSPFKRNLRKSYYLYQKMWKE